MTVSLRLSSHLSIPDSSQESFDFNDFIVLEVPNEVVDQLESGQVVLKGLEDDDATLCTKSSTYSIKKADTSNLLMITQPTQEPALDHTSKAYRQGYQSLNGSWKVIDVGACYYEVLPCLPQLDRLVQLLRETSYRGLVEESEKAKRMTLAYILNNIQASQDEIMKFLQSVHAFELNGAWRIMDETYLASVLELVLLYMVERDIEMNHVSLSTLSSGLVDHAIPEQVIYSCLKTFAKTFDQHQAGIKF